MTARAETSRAWLLSGLGWAALAGLAFVIGAGAIARTSMLLLLLGAAAGVVLLARPGWAAVLAVALLPFPNTLLPGVALEISATDLLTVTALLGWVIEALVRPRLHGAASIEPSPRSVRPVALGLLAYGVTCVISMVAHPSTAGVVTALHRVELVVGALVLGGALVRVGLLRPALEGFYVTCVVLTVGAVLVSGSANILGVQKNPAGGYLATALIVVLVLRPGRRWLLYAPLFAIGALATQSRGALLGLAIAAGVTVLVVRYGERSRLLAVFAAAAAALYLAYLNLPGAARTRLLDTSANKDFAIRFRTEFQADAFDVFRSSPWLGEGVGNYQGGRRFPGVTDPHQVLYLTLAEGGVILLIGILVLFAVSLWAAFRRMKLTALAVAALAVQVATLAHAQADVYWVRGTPMAAFLLLGAVLAVAHYAAAGDRRAAPWLRSKHSVPRGQIDPTRLPVSLVVAGARRDG